MDFNGGGGIVGLNPNGGFVPTNNVQQNQANLDYVNAVNQASLNANNLYGPGGFGAATDAYSAAGAAYGRGTGFYGDTLGLPPGAVTPAAQAAAGPNYGGYGGSQYADRSTLDPAQQQYYDAHEARYGYAPPASFFTGSGPQSWNTMYGGGSATADATTTAPPPGGSGIGPGSSGEVTGGGSVNAGGAGNALYDSLSDAQQQYYNAHVARYGAPPPASFFTGSGPLSWNTMYGGGASASAEATAAAAPPGGSGIGPGTSGEVTGGGSVGAGGAGNALYDSLSDAQQQYYNAHVARYGAPPPASFFTGSGPLSWNTMYGGGASASAGASGVAAPPPGGSGIGPGASGQVTGGGSVGAGGAGNALYDSLSDAQQQYYNAHVARYGAPPPMSFFTGTGPLSWNTMYGGGGQPAPFQTATGNAGQSPGMGTGYGGFNNQPGDAVRSTLDDAQQQYFDAHVQRYGYAPPASFFTGSGPLSWNTMYGGGDKNVGDFQQEAINQGQQSMHTLLDQVGAALNPTAPSDTLTDADRAIQPAVPDSGPGSGVEAINKFAGIDPNTNEQFAPGIDRNTGRPFGVPPPTPEEALQFTGNPVNSQQPQQPDFYRSPEQSYKTFQAQNPMVWQRAIPNNDPNIMNAIYATAGTNGVSPASLAALFDQESSFNPKSHTLDNYGVPQMSQNMWSDKPFGGTIGGLTWDQYVNGTAAQQIGAYSDWLSRSGNLTKGGMTGVGDQSPEMQAAILQAINIAPNPLPWRTGLVGGNMSMQTGPPQGGKLDDTSIGAMEDYFRNKMAPWSN